MTPSSNLKLTGHHHRRHLKYKNRREKKKAWGSVGGGVCRARDGRKEKKTVLSLLATGGKVLTETLDNSLTSVQCNRFQRPLESSPPLIPQKRNEVQQVCMDITPLTNEGAEPQLGEVAEMAAGPRCS